MLSMKKLYNLLTLILVFALLAVAVPIAPVSAQSSTIVPFDFSTNLPSNWIIEGELGSGVTVTSGVTVGTDKALRFTIPSGTRRGFSASNNSAPRALQPYESDTFDVTVKFLNTPGTEYAGILGIAVKGWYNTTGGLTYPGYLRFTVDTSDTPNDNTPYEPFASLYYFLDPNWAGIGMTDTTQDYPQLGDGPFWLRVRSEPGTAPDGTGDPVRYYRFWFAVEDPTQNSSNWIQIGMKSGSDYIRNFDVTHIGIVAGNTGDLPALTAYADYIIQTGSPIPNEDALPATITASVSNPAGGSVSISPDGPYTAGQTVTATLSLNPGFELVSWTFNGEELPGGGDNVIVILADGANILTANVRPVDLDLPFSVYLPGIST